MIKCVKNAGFCMGVKRALDIVLGLNTKGLGPLYTDGPLIHNPQIISLLEDKGIKPLAGKSPSRGLIVLRAHGVSPARREELARTGLPIHDATCPNVTKVQAIVSDYSRRGYTVIIVGDRGHAEVEGLLGFAGGLGRVVGGPGEVDSLPMTGKVCVVAQTTQDIQLFRETAERIRKRVSECEVFDTICLSTKKRQKETIGLARKVDAMVVVGGKKSANTARLVKICEAVGTTVFPVESERDLDSFSLRPFRRVGVTGGASTPRWVIERVVQRIEALRARGGARKRGKRERG